MRVYSGVVASQSLCAVCTPGGQEHLDSQHEINPSSREANDFFGLDFWKV